jgi:two-component system sensor histidine kinase KdpD
MKQNFKVGAVPGWLGATLAAGLTTALLVWADAGSTTAGLIFLVLVVWIATQAEMVISLYATLLCTLAFDYFFLPPYRTLRLAGISEWVGVLAFFGSSVVAGRVAERARRQARQAEERRAEVERLYMLSQEMMLYDDAAKLKDELPRIIERVFALEGVILYSSDENRCLLLDLRAAHERAGQSQRHHYSPDRCSCAAR